MGSQLDLVEKRLADTLTAAEELRNVPGNLDYPFDQRAVSLVITKLEEAWMWLGKVVKE